MLSVNCGLQMALTWKQLNTYGIAKLLFLSEWLYILILVFGYWIFDLDTILLILVSTMDTKKI